MKSLSKVVSSFSFPSLKEVKVSHYLKSKLIPIWSDIFGQLSPEFMFEHVRYRQLYISTSNPIWKTEIKYHEPLIVQRLNERLPSSLYFKGIRVFYKERGVNDEQCEQIKKENQRKRLLEASLCVRCGKVVTVDRECIFCRLE
jgi:hypothetical protein